MNVGSVFTGVGGFDLGLERAGHRIVWQCEIEPFCQRVLAVRWPGVPCYEDVRRVALDARPDNGAGRDASTGVQLLCGGFPCQDLSVAGRRAGLAGERSGLFFEFARVADAVLEPGGWVLIENVPGLLSSNGGRDFAVVLATLADLGFHDLAWRVLDSRYFGVPQRRRRVFIVARRAVGDRARQVLLEPESGGGDFTAGAEAGPRVATSLTSGSHGAGVNEPGRRKEHDENIVPALVRRSSRGGSQTLSPGYNTDGHIVNALDRRRGGADDNDAQAGHLICAPTHANRVRAPSGIPRPMDGDLMDPRPDGPRYAAMGNAVTVPVAEWIGRRLMRYV